MKYDFLGVIVFGIVLLIGVAVIAAFITVGVFLIRANQAMSEKKSPASRNLSVRF